MWFVVSLCEPYLLLAFWELSLLPGLVLSFLDISLFLLALIGFMAFLIVVVIFNVRGSLLGGSELYGS